MSESDKKKLKKKIKVNQEEKVNQEKKSRPKSQPKLQPKCFDNFLMAITNDGYLFPCCYCDDQITRNDPNFKKLMAVSKIDDYDSLDEIVSTQEWKNFEENLRNNKGPFACINTCQVRDNKDDIVRKDTWINPKTGEVENIRDV